VKYLGVKNNRIQIVSDHPFDGTQYQVITTDQLDSVSTNDIFCKYQVKNGQLVANQSASKLRIAFITDYMIECGLAEYGRSLATHLVDYVAEIQLFIERNKFIAEETHPKLVNHIVPCWKRGEPLLELAQEVKKYDPDIVLINQEWGLFPDAKYWLSLLTQLSEYRIIVIMHSTFRHQDKMISEAAIKEMIVHLDGAKQLLETDKHISANITVIPHGCPPTNKDGRLWNIYKSDYTVLQSGFAFPYKGFENSLQAIALLKEKYPTIFFTAILSESPYAMMEHHLYHRRLLDLTIELGIENNVGLVRGYQSDNILKAYYRTNRVALFPYQYAVGHECFGSSGAAPTAMSMQIPVISSSINHFSGLPTLKADNPQAIADQLDKLFSDPNVYQEQISKQNRYLEANSWDITAKRYLAVFENNG